MTEEEKAAVEASNAELVRAYQLTFNSQAGKRVLIDLMAFGKFRVPIDNQIDEGKRQAVLRIFNFSLLTEDQLQSVYRGQVSPTPATGAQGND